MIGKKIQNYRISSHLGQGGMGTVYRATDDILQREVALKMLHTPMLEQPQVLERFKKEAQVLARLLHPNIALIYNLIEQDRQHYMVMEFVEGKDLESLKQTLGTIPPTEATGVVIQALEGLHHAHRKGIFHRDIKPSNLILSPDGTVKLMDFGIARVAGEQRMTQVNRIIGTVEYLAPELIEGKEPSPASDIYAMGITLYELLCGRLPFDTQSDFSLMQEILKSRIPAPEKFNPAIPRGLSQALMKSLERRPQQRYADARAFQQALQKALPQAAGTDLALLLSRQPGSNILHDSGQPTRNPLSKPSLDQLHHRVTQPVLKQLRTIREKVDRRIWIAAGIVLAIALLLQLWVPDEGQGGNNVESPSITQANNSGVGSGNSGSPGNVTPGGGLRSPLPPLTESPAEHQPQEINPAPSESAEKKKTVPRQTEKEKPKESDNAKEKKTENKSEEKNEPVPPVSKENERNAPPPEPEPEKKAAPRQTAVLPKMEVTLYLKEAIDPSTSSNGQTLHFRVTRPVLLQGSTIIEQGAAGTGRIKNIGKKKISVVLESVTGIYGQRIPLQEMELSGRIEEMVNTRTYSAFLKKGTTIQF